MPTLPDDRAVPIEAVSRLVARPVDWLWPGRLALGKLALLEGDPGLGKSLLALDLCARLSTGRSMPDDRAGPGSWPALVLNGEDGAEDTVRPRLEALGADLERVFVVRREVAMGECLSFPGQAEALEAAVVRSGARLVVIDPIMAYLEARVQTGNDASVRRALRPLARMAERRGCTVLLVRHLNKKGSGRAAYRGGGSIGFLAACRSGWLVAPDPLEPDRRVLAQVKNNLAPPQPSLAYAVEGAAAGTVRLTWLGASPWTADELVGKGSKASDRPRDRACEFLERFLQDGPRTSREVWAGACQEGLAERTLVRAKQELGVRSERVYVRGVQFSYWLLRGQELPEELRPQQPDEMEKYLGPLRAQFPAAGPLDDL
jgi:putative DNA primase/helicase